MEVSEIKVGKRFKHNRHDITIEVSALNGSKITYRHVTKGITNKQDQPKVPITYLLSSYSPI